MTTKDMVDKRSEVCEFCGASDELEVYELGGDELGICGAKLCKNCIEQIDKSTKLDKDYFRFLDETMWSEKLGVAVLSYRLLRRLGENDKAEMIYFEDDVQKFANDIKQNTTKELPKDSNGNILNAGDSVTLIKDLDVKGANFTAKRGTIVKNIKLSDDVKYIEGKINGSLIVIVSQFTKKI